MAIETYQCRARRESLDRVGRLAGALVAMAPVSGNRIALLGLNAFVYLELTLAVTPTSAPLFTLNYRLKPAEQWHILRESPCRVLCFDTAAIKVADALRDGLDATVTFSGPGAIFYRLARSPMSS